MKQESRLSIFLGKVQDFFHRRGLAFGAYTKNERGRPDFYPHYEWGPTFKCIPLLFGNLYIMKPTTPVAKRNCDRICAISTGA